jgi:ABC-2 type transport system ATP-binding protein
MIEATSITKRFGDCTALKNITCTIPNGCIYGMVGTNGAGKSTFLRLITGVFHPDEGRIQLDGAPIYENPAAKKRICYLPDELYFLPGASMNTMADFYKSIYTEFDMEQFRALTADFQLNPKSPVNAFSKGMKRQAATILALATKPDYLFFDETFDGLDPIMRNVVKGLICQDVVDRGATAVITSHSLRELEDTCDQLALLHKGGIVLQSDIQDLKTNLFKVQIAFNAPCSKESFSGIEIMNFKQAGSVCTLIVQGNRDDVMYKLRGMNPLLLDVLPLTLEEVFTYEIEALGYDYSHILEEVSHENKETI